VTAVQTYAGVVASLLRAVAEAQLKGALADQLQTAVDSRADQPQAPSAERLQHDDDGSQPGA
jgi:hypothetical protein